MYHLRQNPYSSSDITTEVLGVSVKEENGTVVTSTSADKPLVISLSTPPTAGKLESSEY